jgi:hypothetical protein
MTPMKQDSKISEILNMLAMNVGNARNKNHGRQWDHPWKTLMMKPCDSPVECGDDCPGEPTCGFIRPGEWQCNCKEAPCKVHPHQRTDDKNIERPNRRAAIEATKRKQEARRALVG